MQDDPDAPVELVQNLHEFDAATLQGWYAERGIEVHLVPSKYTVSVFGTNMARDAIVRRADFQQAREWLPEFTQEMKAHRQYWSVQAEAPDEPEEIEQITERRSLSQAIERFPFASLYTGGTVMLVLLLMEQVHWMLAIVIGAGVAWTVFQLGGGRKARRQMQGEQPIDWNQSRPN